MQFLKKIYFFSIVTIGIVSGGLNSPLAFADCVPLKEQGELYFCCDKKAPNCTEKGDHCKVGDFNGFVYQCLKTDILGGRLLDPLRPAVPQCATPPAAPTSLTQTVFTATKTSRALSEGDDGLTLFTLKSTSGKFPSLLAGQAIEITNGAPYTYFAVANQVDDSTIEVLVGSKNLTKMPENPQFKFTQAKFDTTNLNKNVHVFSQGSGGGAARFLVNQLLRAGKDPKQITLWQSSRTQKELPDWERQYAAWESQGVKVYRVLSREESPTLGFKNDKGETKGYVSDFIPTVPEEYFLSSTGDEKKSNSTLFVIGGKDYTEGLKTALKSRGILEPLRNNFK